jgi:RNase H-like domain found in reverse transcriptase
VISQKIADSEKLRQVAVFSRTLTSSENNYSTFDKERLAINASLKKLHNDLSYATTLFTLYTNYKNLNALLNMMTVNQRLSRW